MDFDRYRQRIARPDGAREGAEPPWLVEPGPLNPTVAEIAAVLDPTDLLDGEPPAGYAVLVPLIERPGGLTVAFIRRAATLTRDPHFVAFPGGRRDGDETMLETALRETEEEVGLGREVITVLGLLAPQQRVSDRATVVPYVGVIDGDPAYVLNPDEVEAIIEVPLAALYAKGVAWEEYWRRGDAERRVPFFADDTLFGDDLLWGLSAGITWQLLERTWAAAGADKP